MKSKVLNKKISASKIIFCTSLALNIGLTSIVYLIESRSHTLARALERRGYITLTNDIKNPNYYSIAGWTNTIKKLHSEFDIAFFGNSITRGSDFQLHFPDKRIINLGYAGDNLRGMLNRVPMLEAANPKKIFIMAGTNDLVNKDLEIYKNDYIQLISTIYKAIPNTKIYIQSVIPANTKLKNGHTPNEKVIKANEIMESLSDSLHFQFINTYDSYTDGEGQLDKKYTKDGIHLYPEAYDKWAEIIKPYIYE